MGQRLLGRRPMPTFPPGPRPADEVGIIGSACLFDLQMLTRVMASPPTLLHSYISANVLHTFLYKGPTQRHRPMPTFPPGPGPADEDELDEYALCSFPVLWRRRPLCCIPIFLTTCSTHFSIKGQHNGMTTPGAPPWRN